MHTHMHTNNVSPSIHTHAADNDSTHAHMYAYKSRIVIEACTQEDDNIVHVISVMYQVNKVFLKHHVLMMVASLKKRKDVLELMRGERLYDCASEI
jgi:hypothetical protein